MIKNQASQVISAQLIATADGSNVTTGTTTVYVTGDGGTQASGSGTVNHEGNGCWSYVPTQAETNYDHVSYTFTNASAVSATVNVYPTIIDASALNTAAAAIGSDGSGLTEAGGTGDHLSAIPWNAAWDAEVQSEVADALTAYSVVATTDLPTNFADLAITATTGLVSLAADQSGVTIGTVTTNTDMRGTDSAYTGTPPTAAAIADAVWDEAQSGHTTAGTFGLYVDAAISGVSTGGVSAADIADAVWDEARSGHTTDGTFGDVAEWAGGGSSITVGDIRTELNPELTAILQMEQYNRGFAQICDAGLGAIIDLGETVPATGEIRVRFIFKQTGSSQAVFGAREASVERFTLFVNTSDGLRLNFRGVGNAVEGPTLLDGREYDVHVIWSATAAALIVNGTRYNDGGSLSGNLPTVNTLHLGGRKTDSALDLAWSGVIKDFTMRQTNGDLIKTSLPHCRQDWQYVGKTIYLFANAGQSNAVGRAPTPSTNTPTAGTAFDFDWTDFSTDALADPVGYSPNNATSGSYVPNFAKTYHTLTGNTVLHVGVASGASEVVEGSPQPASNSWDTSGDLYGLAVAKIYKALNYYRLLGYRVVFKGILWSQGETDAQAITAGSITKADYKTATKTLFDNFRAEFGDIGFFVSQTGTKTTVDDAPGFVDVRAAQQELADENDYIYMAFTGAVDFPDEGKMDDEVHYTIAGYDEVGAALAASAATARIGQVYSPSHTNPSIEQMLAMAKDTQMDVSVLPDAQEVNTQVDTAITDAALATAAGQTTTQAAIAALQTSIGSQVGVRGPFQDGDRILLHTDDTVPVTFTTTADYSSGYDATLIIQEPNDETTVYDRVTLSIDSSTSISGSVAVIDWATLPTAVTTDCSKQAKLKWKLVVALTATPTNQITIGSGETILFWRASVSA